MQVSKVCRQHLQKISIIFIAKKTERSDRNMNETLYDLEQKRNAIELDIQALYETLQKEIDEQKKI